MTDATTPVVDFFPAGSDQGLRRLIQAIVIRAARDAKKTGLDAWHAQQWLLSEECAAYCHFGRVNYKAVERWAFVDCVNELEGK